MITNNIHHKIRFTALFLVLAIALGISRPAKADIAPPGRPPGTDIVPGEENTLVRMVSETVTLTLLEDFPAGSLGQAETQANFTMRNLGKTEEQMEVRFPLSYSDYYSGDIRDDYAEIRNLRAFVNGQAVDIQRLEMANIFLGGDERTPWAVFDVTFPPGEDVFIEVIYTTEAFGYAPHIVYRYILETGAGWQGTIGSADIIIRLPYKANAHNIMLEGSVGYGGGTTPGATLSGNEIRWHFEDFEPTREHNISLITVTGESWEKVLRAQRQVDENPEDGEAWGQLGLAYKQIIKLGRGVRNDPGGQELFELSQQAYEKATTLLPEDAAWHYGFADLLWARYAWDLYDDNTPEARDFLLQMLYELDLSLQLNPDDERTRNLADEMRWWITEDVALIDDKYVFLSLTATPELQPSPTQLPTETPEKPLPPTYTPTTSATSQAPDTATAQPVPTQIEPSPTHTAQNPTQEIPPSAPGTPICGAAIALPFLGIVLWTRKRERF